MINYKKHTKKTQLSILHLIPGGGILLLSELLLGFSYLERCLSRFLFSFLRQSKLRFKACFSVFCA